MSIPIQCPACQHAFAVADRFAGKKGKCPKCGMIFKAPAAEGLDVFPEVPPAPASVPVVPGPKRLATLRSEGGAAPPSGYDSGAVDTFPVVAAAPVVGNIPRGTPVAAQQQQPTFAAAAHDSGAHRVSARKSKSMPLPVLIGSAVGGLALIGIVLGVVWSLGNNDNAKPIAKTTDATETTTTATDADPAPAPAVVQPPAPPLDVAALAPLRARVMTLEIKTAAGTTKAACFLVAERGYAVTAWHLIERAVSVEAITADDVRISVGGTAAIDAAHDLAIIKLEPTLPVPLEPFELSKTDPNVNTDLAGVELAGATPILAGKFKSTDTMSRLSPSLRAKLKNVLGDWADDTGVVLHSVRLSAGSVGAPLVSKDGHVIGMQVVSDLAGSGLAIHVRHIAALVENAGSTLKPFGEPLTSADPPTVTPTETPGTTPPADPVPLPAPRPEDPIDDLVARITEHRSECEKKNWTAQDAVDYAQFQLLARFINEAATLAETAGTTPENKEKLEAAVRAAMFSLTAEAWPSDAAWGKTNKQVAKGLETPSQGVFALARVVVPTSQGNMVNGVPIALAEIVGESQMIVLPMASGGDKFALDDRLLVIGMHDPAFAVQFKGINVPLVRTKYVLAVRKQD
jgi:predicted Zn finger-like uncharacterized protein